MGTVYRQPGRRTWMLKYFRNGQPLFESSVTGDKTQAKKLLRNRETDIDRGLPVTAKVGRIRFEEGAADLVNEYKVNRRRSLDVLETRLTKHLQPFFAGRRMSTITSADVRTYVTHRLATPIVTGKGDAETSRPVSNGAIH